MAAGSGALTVGSQPVLIRSGDYIRSSNTLNGGSWPVDPSFICTGAPDAPQRLNSITLTPRDNAQDPALDRQ